MRPAVILAILILLLTPALVRMLMGSPAPAHIEETRQEAVPL
jgi:hypothetical protein